VIVYVAVSSSGPYNELAVANADGSNQTALLSSDEVGYFFPAWSPDLDPGTPGYQGSVVFEQWSGPIDTPTIDLWLIDLGVCQSGEIACNERELVQNASAPAWSRQGDKIAYVSHGENKGIHILDLPTMIDTLLIPALDTQNAGWPAWSPDGTQLAYTWYDAIQGVEEIRIKNLANGDDSPRSTNIGASALEWSPSGMYIALHGGGAMRIVNVSTGEMEILPDSTWAQSPTWIPIEETKLVFMNRNGRSGAGKRKIVKRDLVTNQETVIVERNGFHLYEPDWQR
jgi:Tol biopolymer transport system component